MTEGRLHIFGKAAFRRYLESIMQDALELLHPSEHTSVLNLDSMPCLATFRGHKFSSSLTLGGALEKESLEARVGARSTQRPQRKSHWETAVGHLAPFVESLSWMV